MISLQGKARFAAILLFVFLAVNFMAAQKIRDGEDRVPDGQHNIDGQKTLPAQPSGGAVVQGNGINYHGGPVLNGNPVPIYIIWYGNWGTATTTGARASDSPVTQNLIQTFLGSNALGGSGYEAINTTYGDSNNNNVSGHLNFAGSVADNYSQGNRFGDRNLTTIVATHVGHDLPADTGAVYIVATSSDVKVSSGFCRTYCGLHTHATINGQDIKYAFIGNVDQCPSGCEAQSTGPNSPATGVGGADGMINVITHETEEAITDPDLNAWFDASGNEDADKCNFKFGPVQTAPNGSKFNQTFGGHNWLIQMEWENSRTGGCDQTLGGAFH